MRVEGLGLFSENCSTARVFVEDLKTQTTSGVEAFWKRTRNQNPTTGASLQYSFTILNLHLLATMLRFELHLKNPEDLSNLNFCAGV